MKTTLMSRRALGVLALAALPLTGCMSAASFAPAPAHSQYGSASYYTQRGVLAFPRARNSRGCAHRSAPAGTVLNLRRGSRATWCVVDDRGPYVGGRIVDLQPAQFAELGPISAGVLRGVEITW